MRRADKTAHPALPPRPRGNQPDGRPLLDLTLKPGNAAAKGQGNHPWPPKSFAGNSLPQDGEPTGPATPLPRRGHHPHRVANEQPRPAPPKRGSATKNRNDSDTITHPPPSQGTWMPYSHACGNHPRRRRWQYAATATTMSRALAESNPARRNPEDGLPAATPPRNPYPPRKPLEAAHPAAAQQHTSDCRNQAYYRNHIIAP